MPDRRGFLGAVAALVAAPWLPKPKFDWYRDPLPLPPNAEVFTGSFRIAYKVRTDKGLTLLSEQARKRAEQTTRDLGAYIDKVYTERNKEAL
jgi:hypothetical protein